MGKSARVYRNLDVDETGVAAVAVPCKLVGYYVYNSNASARFLKLYDKQAAPTVGTNTPKLTIPIPGSSGANAFDPDGLAEFENGLGVGATTAVGDSDTGAPGSNEVVVNLLWKPIGR